MPAYDANRVPTAVYNGDSAVLWNAEQPANGAASRQVALGFSDDLSFPAKISAEIDFDGDPGACQIDLQTSDTDKDANFITKYSITQADLNAGFVGRIEATDLVAQFVRLVMVSRGNAVNVTAKVTR